MVPIKNLPNSEETLDPQDWESMRALGHRMLDDMVDYLQDRRRTPCLAAHAGSIQILIFKTPAGGTPTCQS